MPTYEYRCENGHQHEEQRSIHDPQTLFNCPQCGVELKPVYSVPGINLVGRGFYSNGG